MHENGREFSKRVNNAVGKGEMSNCSFSHTVFKRQVGHIHKNKGLFEKGLNLHDNILSKRGNNCRKHKEHESEIKICFLKGKKHFLHFQQYFEGQ